MSSESKETTWGVIFDMDGVLVDSYRAHFESWKRTLESHGLSMREAQFARTFGQTNAQIFAVLYPEVTAERVPELADEKEAAYRDLIVANFPEMDGAAQLIAVLHQAGARLAIGSSGPPENVRAVLKVLPGGQHFAASTSSADVRHSKPAPDVFLRAAEKLGLPPGRCVVVEDAPAGVEAGKAAGCAVVGITGTVSRERLAAADLIVDSLRELSPEVLERMAFRNRS
jgi:beta-phosphoglucomutase